MNGIWERRRNQTIHNKCSRHDRDPSAPHRASRRVQTPVQCKHTHWDESRRLRRQPLIGSMHPFWLCACRQHPEIDINKLPHAKIEMINANYVSRRRNQRNFNSIAFLLYEGTWIQCYLWLLIDSLRNYLLFKAANKFLWSKCSIENERTIVGKWAVCRTSIRHSFWKERPQTTRWAFNELSSVHIGSGSISLLPRHQSTGGLASILFTLT